MRHHENETLIGMKEEAIVPVETEEANAKRQPTKTKGCKPPAYRFTTLFAHHH
jgi:hypothetical protein